MVRQDFSDKIYKTENGKFTAVVREIEQLHKKASRSVAPGRLKEMNIWKTIRNKRIPHNILNAKNHEREGEIIAQAGKKGAVTIATNMAGRGVDIILGKPKILRSRRVTELGGLHVMGMKGTKREELTIN